MKKIVPALLLAGACASSHPGDGIDEPLVDAALDSPDAAFCHCHHGFGPGLDATLALQLTSLSPDPVTVRVLALRLEPLDGGPTIDSDLEPDNGSNGYVRLSGPGVDQVTRILGPGESASYELTAYIDFAEELIRPGRYVIHVDLEVDGDSLRISTAPLDVPLEEPFAM